MKRKSEVSGFERKVCIFGYALVPIFFIILYFLMTETYEDLYQSNLGAEMSVGGIVKDVYGYIPRLGEFYQRIAVHFMTPQLSFGMDMVFRLVTAAMASATIYLSAMFVMGRKLKLQYKDVIIYLGVMLILMVSMCSEAFTYRFSYVNNYILALLVTVGFLLLFRLKSKEAKWYKMLGSVLLGFAFGISTELAPVAFLILTMVWAIAGMVRKKVVWRDLWGKYRLQTIGVIGLVLGLIFFYLGGGMGARTNGGYAEVYEYVSLTNIFHDPIGTIYSLVRHLWYNIRYVFFAIPLMSVFIFVEATIFKKKNEYYLWWQVMLLLFCVLFIGATSLVAVHDDLYPRFMVPVFLAVVLAIMLFVRHVVEYTKVSDKSLKITSVVLSSLGVVLVVDMAFAFTVYNRKVAPMLEAIKYNPGNELVVDPIEGSYTMVPSPVFRLKQLPPFDWGPSMDYAKFGL